MRACRLLCFSYPPRTACSFSFGVNAQLRLLLLSLTASDALAYLSLPLTTLAPSLQAPCRMSKFEVASCAGVKLVDFSSSSDCFYDGDAKDSMCFWDVMGRTVGRLRTERCPVLFNPIQSPPYVLRSTHYALHPPTVHIPHSPRNCYAFTHLCAPTSLSNAVARKQGGAWQPSDHSGHSAPIAHITGKAPALHILPCVLAVGGEVSA